MYPFVLISTRYARPRWSNTKSGDKKKMRLYLQRSGIGVSHGPVARKLMCQKMCQKMGRQKVVMGDTAQACNMKTKPRDAEKGARGRGQKRMGAGGRRAKAEEHSE
jgi:hypothetical protein